MAEAGRWPRAAWAWYLAGGLAAVASYLLLPPGLPRAIAFVVLAAALPVAILSGLRLHRPKHDLGWKLLVAGWAVNVPANAVWYLYPVLTGDPLPYPSVADGLFLLSYGLVLAGLVVIVAGRGRKDRGGMVDAVIITLGLSTVVWLVQIEPAFSASGLNLDQRLLSAVAYPLIGLMLLGVVVRLATTRGAPSPSLWFLVLAVLCQTSADTWYSVAVLSRSFAYSDAFVAVYLVAYLLLGVAALHPSMARLAEPVPHHDAGLSWLRVTALTAAALLAPVVGMVSDIEAGRLERTAAGAVGMMVFVLALLRLRMLSVDASMLRAAEGALRESEERYRDLVERAPAVSYLADPGSDGAWRYVSPQIEWMTGYPPEEWVGDPTLWAQRVHPDDLDRVVAMEARVWEEASGLGPGEFPALSMEYRLVGKDGRVVWVRDEAFVVPEDDGTPGTLRGVLVDITDRRALEEQLSRQAFYDALTNLANRALFRDRVQHALVGVRRRAAAVTVLMVDINGFKAVNDTLGNLAGDRVLVEFARRLEECVRPMDTAARLGADEFAVLVEHADMTEAIHVADRILERMKAPFRIDEQELFLDASIGIAESRDPQGVDELMRKADAAMYAAKQEGKAVYEVYSDEVHSNVLNMFELGTDLRRAVERGEFVVHYQPVVELPRGEITGIEALVRWNHPRRGLLQPNDFIPLAEETGLIVDIDRWVLREACRQTREWQRRFTVTPPLQVNVNMSARQLHRTDVVRQVAEALRDSELDPASLTMEITESVLLLDAEATIRGLKGLRELGVRVAIDDFGVGFSSLNYLRRLPVDVVKIDRSFVSGVATGVEEWGLARGIVRLVHGLGLDTVAEGIEKVEQVAHLQALGCHLGQGFYFSRPATAQSIGELFVARLEPPRSETA
ncbi:MAG: putative bifunctional diguanylate cyclase/phosphodiesterase [Actinomycetota bacterium]